MHLENCLVDKDVIICTDVISHGAWDNETETDTLGEELNDWIAYLPLKTGEPTRFTGKSRTAPDINLVHGSRMHLCSSVVGETIGADHMLIYIEYGAKPLRKKREELELQKSGLEALLEARLQQNRSCGIIVGKTTASLL